MSKATLIQEPPQARPWELRIPFPTNVGEGVFAINGSANMTWFARWLVEAYNRDQPKKEDYE